MRRLVISSLAATCLLLSSTVALATSAANLSDIYSSAEQTNQKSGGNGPATGQIDGVVACSPSADPHIAQFAGNYLLDCDSAGPHNETTIAVNPTDSRNVVAASHSYLYDLDKNNALALLRVFTAAYVTRDGGATWTNVHPTHKSFRFLTDPALAFDGDGRLYWSNVATHDSVGGAYSDVSVIVERSDDGGISWTDPAVVAQGNGTVSNGGSHTLFNDKDWITVDRTNGAYRGSVYVTWARQQYEHDVQVESPIYFVRSRDEGASWTTGAEISGASALCSGGSGVPTRCDQNDAGFSSPLVGPDGTIYVAFLNHQYAAGSLRDQVLLVTSSDGGDTWSAPTRVAGPIKDGDGDYPKNHSGLNTLAGCAFRIFNAGNLSISSAGRLYYVYADQPTAGRTHVMVTTSAAPTAGAARTWTAPRQVAATSAFDQIFPWGAVGNDGLLRVGYVERRSASGCLYGYSVATAQNATATTFSAMPVETQLSDAGNARFHRNDPANGDYRSRFIGDYTGIAMDGTHVWAAWTDMRAEVDPFFAIDGHPGLRTEHAAAVRR